MSGDTFLSVHKTTLSFTCLAREPEGAASWFHVSAASASYRFQTKFSLAYLPTTLIEYEKIYGIKIEGTRRLESV